MDLRVESFPQGSASSPWPAEAHRPTGEDVAQRLAWNWTGPPRTGPSSWGQGPPPHPHSHLPPATLPLACAHLLTVGQHALGDPLGQAPRVQPSHWPRPWQEGRPSREALPRHPPPPTSRCTGGGVGKEGSCLKTPPRTFSPTRIPALGNRTCGSTTNLSSVGVQTSPSPTPCCIKDLERHILAYLWGVDNSFLLYMSLCLLFIF